MGDHPCRNGPGPPATRRLITVRIWLITHHYSPEVGAPQRRWGAPVPRLLAAGHTVTVFAPTPHYPAGRSGTVPADQRPGAVATGEHGERIHRLRFREHGPDLLSAPRLMPVVAAATALRGPGWACAATSAPTCSW